MDPESAEGGDVLRLFGKYSRKEGDALIIYHVIEKIAAGIILLIIFFCYCIAEVHNMKK